MLGRLERANASEMINLQLFSICYVWVFSLDALLLTLSMVLEASSSSSRQIQAPADLHLNSEPIDQLSASVASLSPQDHTQRIHIGCRALNHTQEGFPAWKA